MRRLVVLLIVIDAKHRAALANRHAESADLGWEIAGCHAGHDYECGKSMEVRHVNAKQPSWNFGIMPIDRKSDGCIAKNAEVVGVVRVLPYVLAIDKQVLAECLLQSGMELIPKSCRRARRN